MTGASGSNIKSTISNLDKIRASIPPEMAIRVGVLGEKASREGDSTLNNAEIGIIQEFGSISGKIPPRSWLRMPIETHIGQIAQFMGSTKILNMILAGKAIQAFELVGVYAEGWVKSAFATSGFGSWKPNSPYTIDKKGSAKPLIDSSQLRRSVTSEVVNG